MQPECVCGSFIVHDCETTPSDYFLSVRGIDKVELYQIHRREDGTFSISSPLIFHTIPILISHYSQQAGTLCSTLKASHAILGLQRNISRWEIDRNTINISESQLTRLLRFHKVTEGEWNGTPVSIKEPRQKGTTNLVRNFFDEVELMKKLKHNNIIELLGVCTRENPMYMLLEHTNYENLKVYLESNKHVLHSHKLIDMGIQIASAMVYLGGKKCVHRSLQTVNVALHLSDSVTCKVANFTHAKIISKGDYVKSFAYCPIKWTAPESLKSKCFTIKSDVWSFGIVLYELITCGKEPYPGMDEYEILDKLECGYLIPCPGGCTARLYDIMKECWGKDFNDRWSRWRRKDAKDRPSFETLQQKLIKLQ